MTKPVLVVDDSGAIQTFVQATLEANEEGEPSNRGRARTLALGASAYREKPFSSQQLLDSARELMAGEES